MERPILNNNFPNEKFEVVGEYCNFCGDLQTKCFISSDLTTTANEKIFVDARLDLENNQIDIQFGLLNSDNSASVNSDWTYCLDIHYCPVCGKKLKK